MTVATPEDLDIRIKWNGYIPHAPSEKQHAGLLVDDVEEVMYGGQAGGGKSDWLLQGALQWVDTPGYAALILRRSYSDLSQPGAIMSRAKQWLRDSDATWNENRKKFTFPSGAELQFGYLQRDDDVYQYQSAEYQYIGIDELTQFTQFQYTYMFSRLRRLAGSRIPLRMRVASNPGGKGHQWVRRYYIKEGKKSARLFIPASLEDNIFIDQEAYKKSLEHLDPYTKAQLLHGDWTARPPGNWAFDHEHLDAVFSLGDIYRRRYRAGDLPPPLDGKFHTGIDFGEASHVLLGYPLEMQNQWICKEHVYSHGEPDREAKEYLEKIHPYLNPEPGVTYKLGWTRYDSSKPESFRLFSRTLRELHGPEFGKKSPVPFNKYKRFAILHMRGMASRTAWGETMGTLGISVEDNPILEAQLYDLQFKGEDTEDLVKENDHGPDALFAYLAPETKNWSPPSDKPKGEKVRAERQYQEKVSNLASG